MEGRGQPEAPARRAFGSIDASARRPKQKGSLKEEVLWRRGLAAAADGAFVTTSDGRIDLWNPAAERLMEYRPEEILGRSCREVFASRYSDDERYCSPSCRLHAPIKSGEPVETFDLRTHTKSGRPIWLNVSTVVMPVTSRGSYRVIRMFRDVTAVKDMLTLIRDRLSGTPDKQDPIGRLTRREVEVLRLLTSGATNRILATRLHISPATVRNHTHKIFEKLGVPNRVAAVTYAISKLIV